MKAILGGVFARAIMPILVLLCMTHVSVAHALSGPLRTDSRNPHYFTDDSGKSIYLSGTGVHGTFQPNTFSNPNYTNYLNAMVTYGHNLERMRIWNNGWIKDDPSGWKAIPRIYQRHATICCATDGGNKFDLTKLNDTGTGNFFTTLRNKVIEARDKNIYVMIMFLMGYSFVDDGRDFWGGNPYHASNNMNGINGDPNGDGWGIEAFNLSIPAITTLQETYIRKILDTLNDLDNVIYEVGNELHSTDAYENYIVNYVRTYEATKPKQHVVGRSTRFIPTPFTYGIPSTEVYFTSNADWVAPNFMGVLNLSPPIDSRKVMFYDTDHNGAWLATAPMVFLPWKAFMRGHNFIFMDDAVNPGVQGREPVVVEAIRTRLGQTLSYSKKVNLVAMRPNNALSSTAYCLASPGAEYIVYQPGSGTFNVNLLAGTYSIEWFNPATGGTTSGSSFSAATGAKSFTPPFSGEAVLYLKTGGAPPDTVAPRTPTNLRVSQ